MGEIAYLLAYAKELGAETITSPTHVNLEHDKHSSLEKGCI